MWVGVRYESVRCGYVVGVSRCGWVLGVSVWVGENVRCGWVLGVSVLGVGGC